MFLTQLAHTRVFYPLIRKELFTYVLTTSYQAMFSFLERIVSDQQN